VAFNLNATRDIASSDTLLASVSGIDLTTGAPTPVNLYTVPLGKSLVLTKAVVRVTNVATPGTAPRVGFGVTGDDMLPARDLINLAAVDDCYLVTVETKGIVANGGDVIKLVLDTAATHATLDVTVDIFGVFTSALPAVGEVEGWTSFTPTGSWTTNVTYVGYYRQIEDTLDIKVRISFSGAPDTATLTLNLPPGFTTNTSKLIGNGVTSYEPAGQVICHDAGVSVYAAFMVWRYDLSAWGAVRLSPSGSNVRVSPSSDQVNQATPFTWGAGDFLLAQWTVPVNEGLSGAQAAGGAGIPSWVNFTPTGSWTNPEVTYTGRYLLTQTSDGYMMDLTIDVETNSVTPTPTVELTVNMPPGFECVLPPGNQFLLSGTGSVAATGQNSRSGLTLINSSTVLGARYLDTNGYQVGVSPTLPFSAASTNYRVRLAARISVAAV